MNIKIPPNLQGLLAIIAVLVSAVTVTVVVVDSNGDGKNDTVKVGVEVNKKAGDGQPTATVEAPQKLVKEAAEDNHQDLATAPEGAPKPDSQDLKKADEVEKAISERGPPLEPAGAVQGFNGCVTRILPVNYSSRNGARPVWQVLHYTVSHNVTGWGDVNAIINLFSNSGRQASSNFVIDAEGHCAYIVPIEAKAWTQAGGNPWSISYEIIAFGDETAYLGPAGFERLRSVAHQVAKRTGIPLRAGSVTGSCTPGSAGIVQHKDFGLCGGGHVDITPFSKSQAIKLITSGTRILTAKERKIVAGARHPKGTGHTRRYWCNRLGDQVRWLDKSAKQPRRGQRLKILRRVKRGVCG